MAITADQFAPAVTGKIGPGGTLTTTFNNQPSILSTILIGYFQYDGSINPLLTITDNAVVPNTYVIDTQPNGNTADFAAGLLRTQIWKSIGSVLSLPASGNLSITITNNSTSTIDTSFAARSYLGMQTRIDVVASTFNSSSSSNVTSLSPNFPSELFFTVYNNALAGNHTPQIASPFTLITSITNGTLAEVGGIAEFIASDSSAQTATWSLVDGTSGQNMGVLAVYPPVPSSPAKSVVVETVTIKRAGLY